MDHLINHKSVIVCTGTGGVGKTTLSAAIAVRAAQAGRKVLVLTVDPARRLAAALGIELTHGAEVEVPGQNYTGKLYAAQIDSKFIFDAFVRNSSRSHETAEKIISNRIYEKLSTSLSGSQEFTALEKLYSAHISGKYDLVVLDTPPAGHAIDFLDGAAKLEALFQESIVKWFVGGRDRESFFQGLLHRGTHLAFKGLEILTGSEFIRELQEFFNKVYDLKDAVIGRMAGVHKLLQAESTAFVLVTVFDSSKLQEAAQFEQELRDRGHFLSAVIVNRSIPPLDLSHVPSQMEWLKVLYTDLKNFYQQHEKAMIKLQQSSGEKVDFLNVPDFDQEILNLRSLEDVAALLEQP